MAANPAEKPSAAAAGPAIEVRGLEKRFGPVEAVRGVDLDVRPGELFGLIGHNGAGKSTLFRMMLGLLAPSAGSIRLHGEAVGGPNARALRRRIGYLPENVVLYDNLSGLETLRFFAKLKGAPERDCAPLLERVGLSHAASRRVREYSKGMRQRLGFAQALLGAPAILFLDEPTTGLDPEAIREFYRILAELKADGVTMILTSHILAEIQARVDRLAIMAAGRIEASGSVQELREALDLPVTIELAAGAGLLEQVRAALAGLPVESVVEGAGHVAVRVRRDAKLAALARLATLGEGLRDLHVREPSLEDVFFGHRG